MASVTLNQAACCLLTASSSVLAAASADPAEHVYLSALLTRPYCSHDGLVARVLNPTTIGPDGIDHRNPAVPTARWFDRFEVGLFRVAPWFDPTQDECLSGIYGACDDDGTRTLSGHHNTTLVDQSALRDGLVEAWCDCMADAGRPRHFPAWLETVELVLDDGRFGGVVFVVAAAL